MPSSFCALVADGAPLSVMHVLIAGDIDAPIELGLGHKVHRSAVLY